MVNFVILMHVVFIKLKCVPLLVLADILFAHLTVNYLKFRNISNLVKFGSQLKWSFMLQLNRWSGVNVLIVCFIELCIVVGYILNPVIILQLS